MPAAKIITPGTRFGRWTALEKTELRHYPSGAQQLFRWCRCDCGTEQWVGEYKLRTGHSRSCGCLLSEVTAARNLTHGYSGGGQTRVYRIWQNMLNRCRNPNIPGYERYGGRGITVSERWLTFENFLEDMGEPPDDRTLDRIDNNGNYSKENCAWSTPVDQARNRRNSIKLIFNGETRTLVEWCELLNLSYRTMRARHAAGWPVEDIFTVPIGGNRRV